jgi:hypothetical protein
MKIARIAILLILARLSSATQLQAQEHLVPEASLLATYDEYELKIHEVFASAYSDDVVCKVVFLNAFLPEEVVGLRKTPSGHKVFLMKPSSIIWDTMKKRTPSDFRKITTNETTVPINDDLVHRIAAIWERMLLATRQPKETHYGVDGGASHFSMFISGRGIISGQVWSPDPGTKTAALETLAYTLPHYVGHPSDTAALEIAVENAEKATKD